MNQAFIKIPLILLLVTTFALLQTACSSNVKSNKPLIERNEEVKEYFTLLDTLVVEYCNMVESMDDKGKTIENKEKNGEETCIMDGFDILKGFVSSSVKMARIGEKIEKLEEKHPKFEKELTADDFEEFMNIYTKMIERFITMGKKYEEHKSES